jgi:hypothetical protein
MVRKIYRIPGFAAPFHFVLPGGIDLAAFFKYFSQGLVKFVSDVIDPDYQSVFYFSQVENGSVCLAQEYYRRNNHTGIPSAGNQVVLPSGDRYKL